MKTIEAVNFFKTQAALAELLDITQPSVAEWGDEPPAIRQIQLERLSGGKLRANPRCYEPAAKFATKRAEARSTR